MHGPHCTEALDLGRTEDDVCLCASSLFSAYWPVVSSTWRMPQNVQVVAEWCAVAAVIISRFYEPMPIVTLDRSDCHVPSTYVDWFLEVALYRRHHNPLFITNHSWILTIHKDRIFWKKLLEKTFLTFKKWVKNIQTVGYNGARTVIQFIFSLRYQTWIPFQNLKSYSVKKQFFKCL